MEWGLGDIWTEDVVGTGGGYGLGTYWGVERIWTWGGYGLGRIYM